MGRILELAMQGYLQIRAENHRKFIEALNNMSLEDALLKALEYKSCSEKQIAACNRNPVWDFSNEKEKTVFAESVNTVLIPFSDVCKDLYIKTRENWISIPEFYEEQKKAYGDDYSWLELNALSHFTCAVYNKNNDYMGYIGIKNVCEEPWEISIELLSSFCNHGLGEEIFIIFVKKIHELTGKIKFKLLIEVDNIVSQAFFDKIGAQYSGLERVLFQNDKDEKEYEDSHLELIDNQLVGLAEKIDVDSKKLLTHVLKYYYVVK